MNELALPEGLAPAQDGEASPDRSHAPPRTLAGSTALIVLGMHRSGTSSLAGVLHHLGVALGENLMPASPDNPQGYWEHADVVRVDDDLLHGLGSRWDDVRPFPAGWAQGELARLAGERLREILSQEFAAKGIWGLKDPRLCRLMPLWLPLLQAWQVKPRFILMLRHPLEVVASLAKRDGLGAGRSGLLWLRHVLEAEATTRGHPRAIVHYEDWVGGQGWRPSLARLTRGIGMTWPAAGPATEAAIESYLAPELRHHRAGDGRAEGAAQLTPWLESVYAAFRAGDETRLRTICDSVRGELDRADGLFAGVLDDAVRDLSAGAAHQEAQTHKINELTTLLNRLAHEVTELRAATARKDTEVREQKAGTGAVTPQGTRQRQPLAMEEAYPKWIERRASTAVARTDWLAERVAQWPFMPKLSLAMILPAGSEDRVALTLRSLLLQIVGDWELHVVAEGKMPAPFAAEKRLHWYEAGRGVELLNRTLIDSRAHWIALIDAGDQLAPHALFGIADALFRHPEWSAVYSDEDRIDPRGQRSGPHFKPDFNLDLLRSMPYVGGLLAVRSALFAEMGGFDQRWDGTEEYDIALRLAERLGAVGFGHVADVLYHRLTVSGRSKRTMQDICADMPKVLQAHFDRLGVKARAESGTQPHFCRVWYEHEGPEPLVSIVVPTKNQLSLLKRCVETVLQKTDYQNYEVIIVDNGSTEDDACAYLQAIEDKEAEIGTRLRVLRHPEKFNFSTMNNRAVREMARGEYICLLNNDAAPLDGAWLSEMMNLARRSDVGIVGAKLFYPDGKIQHGGVILGVGWGSPADHPYNREPGNAYGYWGRLNVVQDFSVVTAACLVTRRSVYEEVKGLDEETFAVAYNDVDYCLKVREAGYLIAWTPFARLLHESSASLKSDVEGKAVQEKNARFGQEQRAMYARWMPQIANDPAYNRNLSSLGFGFAVETEGAPTWDPEFRPRERVLVFPADREGCGEYRIIAPSRALFRAGVVHSYETMRLLTPPEVERMAPDSIVFQRQLEWGQIEVINRVKFTTPKTLRIFELDDLITNLPLKSAHRATISPDIGNRLKTALALCDRLVVSTEPLARQYGKLCGETIVVPNRLERARWDGHAPKRRPEGKPRVGWAGAVGHLGDLSLMASVVEATAKEVDWVFFGMCPDKLKPHVAEFHEWVQLPDYAAKLATLDLDLAVAPLELNPFNEAKSNLRLLEYGVLGYPVLCTDILPYQGDLPVTRISNRHRDWVKMIRDMVADREALREEGERLRAAVMAEWMLEDHLDTWKKAWLP